ncbi:MAG: hypothetical protein K6G80_00580 [Treponema sp.]|nr:hypothetical protein [Treponema sp.]
MTQKIKIPLKAAAFVAGFFVLSAVTATLLRDDAEAYSRILLHELYNQDRIDVVYCGASHVSHGIVADVADEMTGMKNFSLGTAAQSIDGTYAVLRQAVKLYDIQKVFLELDFAVATQPERKNRNGFSSDYLVALYLKDPLIKADFLLNVSTPAYYVNHMLPIGKDKHLTLRPQDLSKKLGGVLNGDYFRYNYLSKDSAYNGRGCVMDYDVIKKGSFHNDKDEGRIRVDSISRDWKATIDKIIALCRENNIALTFYSMPCSDFYLNEKGNYDEYYTQVKAFCRERGFDYFDFNLAKPEYLSVTDEDWSDDNHFNRAGVYKWTKAFWTFFNGGIAKEDFFYTSYREKMAAMGDTVFGVIAKMSGDKKSVSITPVTNVTDENAIAYEVTALTATAEHVLHKNKVGSYELPPSSTGKLRIKSYLHDVLQTDCTMHYTSL